MDVLRALTYHLTVALDRGIIVHWPIGADVAIFGTLPSAALQQWLHRTADFHWKPDRARGVQQRVEHG